MEDRAVMMTDGEFIIALLLLAILVWMVVSGGFSFVVLAFWGWRLRRRILKLEKDVEDVVDAIRDARARFFPPAP
jgi:hypothetical protein